VSALLLAALLAGCTKPGLYALSPIQSRRRSQDFLVDATAEVDYRGTVSDLRLHLSMHYTGATSAKVDLSALWWKVDGVAWQRCRHAKSTDKDTLIFNLKRDKSRTIDLTCLDIPRPYDRVELRFHTAGTGSLGVVGLEFEGIAQPL
jgi:hypothetical protein